MFNTDAQRLNVIQFCLSPACTWGRGNADGDSFLPGEGKGSGRRGATDTGEAKTKLETANAYWPFTIPCDPNHIYGLNSPL